MFDVGEEVDDRAVGEEERAVLVGRVSNDAIRSLSLSFCVVSVCTWVKSACTCSGVGGAVIS